MIWHTEVRARGVWRSTVDPWEDAVLRRRIECSVYEKSAEGLVLESNEEHAGIADAECREHDSPEQRVIARPVVLAIGGVRSRCIVRQKTRRIRGFDRIKHRQRLLSIHHDIIPWCVEGNCKSESTAMIHETL